MWSIAMTINTAPRKKSTSIERPAAILIESPRTNRTTASGSAVPAPFRRFAAAIVPSQIHAMDNLLSRPFLLMNGMPFHEKQGSRPSG
jgi:hypothetical protein